MWKNAFKIEIPDSGNNHITANAEKAEKHGMRRWDPIIRTATSSMPYFERYVFNDLPSYLIRIRDMKLLSRNEISEDSRRLVESMEVDLEAIKKTWGETTKRLKDWCKWRIQVLLRYAILSHRWGIGEPAFYEMSSKRYGDKPKPIGLAGFEKLVRFCKVAETYGCAYAWSDTCCINKESSAELEEAIPFHVSDAKSSTVEDFPKEPWFTRGWTLQELLAPRRLRFFGKNWKPVCPKKEQQSGDTKSNGGIHSFRYPNDKVSDFMLKAISQVTDIRVTDLQGFSPWSVAVCEKMRWASKRKTTRVEDVAYSLLGIFDVSMPIAYGEGERAFHRLMEAIAQKPYDPTLFAWAGYSSSYSKALPSSPECYGRLDPGMAPRLRGIPHSIQAGYPFYLVTNIGLEAKLLVIPGKYVRVEGDSYTVAPADKAHTGIIKCPVTYVWITKKEVST
ncbi:hypothetical protein BU15DRAFT_66975 [Melanogaster broomeanus]|nr:hypothetical protein BU15DRAFT_66975 [Melanogaster broomeanus]